MRISIGAALAMTVAGAAFAAPALAQTTGAAATSSQTQGTATTPQTTAALDPNERICETRADIGSRLARTRECHTRAEWDRMRENQRDATSDNQMRGLQNSGQNPG